MLPCSFGVYFSLLPRPPLSTTPRSKRPCVFHVLIIPRIKAPEQFVSHSKAINYASNDFLILYLVSRELEEEAAFYSLPLLYIIIIFIIIPHSLFFFSPPFPCSNGSACWHWDYGMIKWFALNWQQLQDGKKAGRLKGKGHGSWSSFLGVR